MHFSSSRHAQLFWHRCNTWMWVCKAVTSLRSLPTTRTSLMTALMTVWMIFLTSLMTKNDRHRVWSQIKDWLVGQCHDIISNTIFTFTIIVTVTRKSRWKPAICLSRFITSIYSMNSIHKQLDVVAYDSKLCCTGQKTCPGVWCDFSPLHAWGDCVAQ